jgi:hypothetical protein
VLNSRRRRIYDRVVNAGPDGVSVDDLIKAMYIERIPPPAAKTVIRVQICETNRVLKDFGQKIVSNRLRGYRLVEASS